MISAAGWAREVYRRNPLLATVAAAHLALFLVLLPAAYLDPLTILGVSRWIKPMKFAISIAIFTATMAWILGWLRDSDRDVRVVSWVITAAMTGEIVLITMQSARVVRSHFNADSAFDLVVFNTMGMLIVMNTLAAGRAAYLFYRRGTTIGGALLAGLRLGLLIFVVASLEGFVMVARMSHSVGIHDGGPGLPLVNWSTGAGDLRVAHFFGMHALQVLPLLGAWMDRQGVAPPWLGAVAAGYFLAFVLLVVQALSGRPLLAALG